MYIENNLRAAWRHHAGRRADRPVQDRDPGLFHLHDEDHIAPWKTTLSGRPAVEGPGTVHARRLRPHRRHRQSTGREQILVLDQRQAAPAADEWLATAEKHEGSWWTDWENWIAGFGGDKIPARRPGDGKLKVIEDAPGTYAKFRLDQTPDAAPEQSVPASETRAAAPERPSIREAFGQTPAGASSAQTVHAASTKAPRKRKR